ncbi:hypothetical protein DFH27DRAFT_579249 [Peziza echinospora]|nr:hypothetical protein DFH27DRAFT_579249 [Peziza echinospora]
MATDFAAPPADGDAGIVLYDIAFYKPYNVSTSAPNPWKARYALNFKAVPYSTRWVSMLDISSVRKSLGIPAGRKFADGTDFYTLPCLVDSANDVKLGDSFDIATYLQDTYPAAGVGELFPAQELEFRCPGLPEEVLVPLSKERDVGGDRVRAEYARFQTHVDMAFSFHAQLSVSGMRWDEEINGAVRAEFARRTGLPSWEALQIQGDARAELLEKLRATLGALGDMLGRDEGGPYLLGARPSYADCIVGAWLRMMSKTLPEEEWEQFRGWYGGVFGRLHDALQEKFGDVK